MGSIRSCTSGNAKFWKGFKMSLENYLAAFDLNVKNFSTTSGGIIETKYKRYYLDFVNEDSTWFLYDPDSGDRYDNRIAAGRKTARACPFQILAKAMKEIYKIVNPNDKGVF